MTDSDRTPEEKAVRRKAAAPNLVLGALSAVAGLWGFFTGSVDFAWPASIMFIEILVIHSFPFMMLIGSYRPKTSFGEKTQKVAFWTMLSVYVALSLKEWGLSGAIAFAGLTVSTYLGYLLRRTGPDAVAELIGRWVMSFLAYLVAMKATGISADSVTWAQSVKTPFFAMLYFTALGLLELYGFYQQPKVRQIAAHVRTAFENSRRT